MLKLPKIISSVSGHDFNLVRFENYFFKSCYITVIISLVETTKNQLKDFVLKNRYIIAFWSLVGTTKNISSDNIIRFQKMTRENMP